MYSCGFGATSFQNKECTALVLQGRNKNGGLASKKVALIFVLLLYEYMPDKKASFNDSMVYAYNTFVKKKNM